MRENKYGRNNCYERMHKKYDEEGLLAPSCNLLQQTTTNHCLKFANTMIWSAFIFIRIQCKANHGVHVGLYRITLFSPIMNWNSWWIAKYKRLQSHDLTSIANTSRQRYLYDSNLDFRHLPIRSTWLELRQNSDVKYKIHNKTPLLLSMAVWQQLA